MKKFLITLMTLVMCEAAFAGFSNDVKVIKMGVGHYYKSVCGGVSCVFIKGSPAAVDSPACATGSHAWDFVLITEDKAGEQAYNFLMAHYLAGKKVSISGTGTCVGNVEKVNYIYVK